MNVIFTCGGTGGHINPGIAVANILRERYPDSNILFVGGEGGMEEDLVPKAGYKIEALPCSSLRRGLSPKSIIHNAKGVGYVVSALKKSKKLIESFQPDVILGTGGYASFPALYMGTRMGIPTCVHEANAVPGLATRLVADRVDQILVTFARALRATSTRRKSARWVCRCAVSLFTATASLPAGNWDWMKDLWSSRPLALWEPER